MDPRPFLLTPSASKVQLYPPSSLPKVFFSFLSQPPGTFQHFALPRIPESKFIWVIGLHSKTFSEHYAADIKLQMQGGFSSIKRFYFSKATHRDDL